MDRERLGDIITLIYLLIILAVFAYVGINYI